MCVHSHYNWRMNLELRSWLQTGITCNYLRTKTHIGCADPLSKVPGHLPYTLQGTPGSPSHPLTGPWSPKLCRCSATLLTPENERRFKWAHLSLTKPSRQDEVMKRLGVNNSVFHIPWISFICKNRLLTGENLIPFLKELFPSSWNEWKHKKPSLII